MSVIFYDVERGYRLNVCLKVTFLTYFTGCVKI